MMNDILFSIAFGLITLGAVLLWLPKWNHTKWSFAVREDLVAKYEAKGDFKKAEQIKHEMHVFRSRLPLYAKVILATGGGVLLASFFYTAG